VFQRRRLIHTIAKKKENGRSSEKRGSTKEDLINVSADRRRSLQPVPGVKETAALEDHLADLETTQYSLTKRLPLAAENCDLGEGGEKMVSHSSSRVQIATVERNSRAQEKKAPEALKQRGQGGYKKKA